MKIKVSIRESTMQTTCNDRAVQGIQVHAAVWADVAVTTASSLDS
ncbi:hypothetical protein RISK_006198 [Rhodopirellula islandica]|uniref:Uncharacterized protein n=1 Tax=Rhodopirellula islandica TaxID=595434 RepID=A0A0J1E8C4_RHOIS|nr:hypothetical protein RISK_006198 [Rhodopirellula islandica]